MRKFCVSLASATSIDPALHASWLYYFLLTIPVREHRLQRRYGVKVVLVGRILDFVTLSAAE
jgi:hypothetical protein